MTHICVSKLTIIGSDNGLSPRRRQAFIRTNAGILLNRRLGTNFSDILIGNQTFSFKKMHLKMSSAKWRPFCLGLNVLQSWDNTMVADLVARASVVMASTKIGLSESTTSSCCRSIPATHGRWNDSRQGSAESGIVLSPWVAGIDLPQYIKPVLDKGFELPVQSVPRTDIKAKYIFYVSWNKFSSTSVKSTWGLSPSFLNNNL